MTSKLGLIALAGLAGLALTAPAADAQTTRSTGGYIFTDLLITSMRGGRTVATTRTDGQGNFRFDLPAGDYNICLNGPGLRSVIDRSGGSAESDSIIGVLIGLLLPAVQANQDGNRTFTIRGNEQQLTFPRGVAAPGQSRRGDPPPPARDLCFPYAIAADSGPAGPDREGRPDRDLNGEDLADGGRTGGVRVAVGDVTGDGRADRPIGPRIPPPAARGTPTRPAAAAAVAVTGAVRLVR